MYNRIVLCLNLQLPRPCDPLIRLVLPFILLFPKLNIQHVITSLPQCRRYRFNVRGCEDPALGDGITYAQGIETALNRLPLLSPPPSSLPPLSARC